MNILKNPKYTFYKYVFGFFLFALFVKHFIPFDFMKLCVEAIMGSVGVYFIIIGSRHIKNDYHEGILKIIVGSSLLTGGALISGIWRYFIMDLHIFFTSNFAFYRNEKSWKKYEKYEILLPIITGIIFLSFIYSFGFIDRMTDCLTPIGLYILSIAYSINNLHNFSTRRILGVIGGLFIVIGGGIDIYFNWGNWYLFIISGAFAILNVYFVFTEVVNYKNEKK